MTWRVEAKEKAPSPTSFSTPPMGQAGLVMWLHSTRAMRSSPDRVAGAGTGGMTPARTPLEWWAGPGQAAVLARDIYLVPHEVLLEGVAVLEHLEAVRAEEVPCVLVYHPEMAIHL